MMKFKVNPEIFAKWPEVKIGVIVALGVNNQKDTPAAKEILALLRRARASQTVSDINPLVNLYNNFSLKYQLPFGGEDLDKIQGDIVLKICEGSEKGVYIGGEEEVACELGEVAYCDEAGFICRRWNWREAERTKFDPQTQAAVIVVEAMPPATEEDLRAVIEEITPFLVDKLGGKVQTAILTKDSPDLEVNYQFQKKAKVKAVSQEKRKPEKIKAKKEKAAISKLPSLLQGEWLSSLQREVLAEIKKAVRSLDLDDSQVKIDHPADLKFGDFTTSIAMVLFSQSKKDFKSPLELAEKIAIALKSQTSTLIDKVETVKPGYLNLWLKKEAFINQLKEVLKTKENYGKSAFLKGKKILLEHTSPNPITTMHIGHMRNNFLGMAVYRLLQTLGAQVTLDCINNDRGTHVSRAIMGYLVFGKKDLDLPKEELLNFSLKDEEILPLVKKANWRELLKEWSTSLQDWYQPEDLALKSDHMDLVFYSLGYRAEKLGEGIKDQFQQILRDWEAGESQVRKLWRQIIDWSQEGYNQTYKRIGSRHDHVWHESDLYQEGKDLVQAGLKKGIFTESKGAIITDLAAYNLPDTVIIKSDKTSLYITFDINLTKQKREKFPSDLYIWDIGNDHLLYMKQQFAVCEQLGIGKREDYFHLNYGYVFLEGGQKMSSRKGTIVSADELLDLLKDKARQIMAKAKETAAVSAEVVADQISEAVGLAAVKYGLLKTYRCHEIHFDPNKSVSLKGDSGPYLQYTYARCQSVLEKALKQKTILDPSKLVFTLEEETVLRWLYRYPEVILEAGRRFDPSLICHFLLELAQIFNLFYNRHSILKAKKTAEVSPNSTPESDENISQQKISKDNKEEQEQPIDQDLRRFRLALTAGTAQILRNGLELLGIEALERM